ncbi:hypothetical protein LXA43DRAFT_1084491 [Ganoderma leucocontextum]|nr:hypothetical protein LXA43DRAFT_1084491 [Ganoderma leucocontextum]
MPIGQTRRSPSNSAATSRALIHLKEPDPTRTTLRQGANARGYASISPPLQSHTNTSDVVFSPVRQIVLSDVVVWWRVWVLWWDNRAVLVSGCVLLLATFATGIVDTTFSCNAQGGFMYEGLLVGTMASALSLATSLAATVLIAHKAWVHRRCIKMHVANGPRNTLVEGVLTLLVESGALYCTLWVVVVVWQIGESTIDDPHLRSSVFFSPKFSGNHWHHDHGSSFWFVGGVLIEGCLVPLIAIYPTVIIVLVALNKSAVENGMKRDVAGLPAITVTVELVVDMQRDVEDGVRRSPSSKTESISDVSHSKKRLEGDLEAARMS